MEKTFEENLRTQLQNTELTEADLNELYNSLRYNMSVDELVEDIRNYYDSFDSTAWKESDVEESFNETIEVIKITKKLEIELYNVGQNVKDYFDRLIKALNITKEYYLSKYAA